MVSLTLRSRQAALECIAAGIKIKKNLNAINMLLDATTCKQHGEVLLLYV
jgi:hypothetical protein